MIGQTYPDFKKIFHASTIQSGLENRFPDVTILLVEKTRLIARFNPQTDEESIKLHPRARRQRRGHKVNVDVTILSATKSHFLLLCRLISGRSFGDGKWSGEIVFVEAVKLVNPLDNAESYNALNY